LAIEHSSITDAERHEPVGISTAASGQLYIADGAGSGAWSAAPSAYSAEVIVKTATDFPTPNVGIITLLPDTIYIIDGHIDIGTDVLALAQNTWLKGTDAAHSSITHTGTGNLFTASLSFTLSGFGIFCTSGTVFSCTGTVPSGADGYESTYLKELTISSATSLGSFHDWYSVFWDKGAAVSFTDSLDFSGTCNILILDLVSFLSGYTAAAVDLGTATFNTCSFFRCGFTAAAPTNHIVAAASNANINAGKTGRINFCTFASIATPIAGIAVSDVQWQVFDNLGAPGSARAAQGYLPATYDTALSTSTPAVVDMNSTFVSALADQFTVSSAGRITYDGLTKATFSVTAVIAGTADAGTNQNFNHWIYKNGVVVAASKTRKEYNSSAVGSPAPCMAIVELDPTDYIELWVENDGAANNWESHIINIKVTEVI
jgi:hypothetical protein